MYSIRIFFLRAKLKFQTISCYMSLNEYVLTGVEIPQPAMFANTDTAVWPYQTAAGC